ncbi:hypothetical protein [Psychroflexus tropicus]|uniref:hypothetical protein n=1 Tax=Psychroflexus tropicus TaxID=197345 RepID=UPI0003AB186D|nr:hypothetical protein [Psychroflexus tropicus]
MRIMIRRGLIITFLLLINFGFSQEKNEVEKRVKKNEVPETALEWLKDAYEKKRRTKWYFQTDGEEEVFEAKLKHKRHLHSIEFNMRGVVQNIEVLIKEKEIDEDVYEVILSYLKETYTKYSLSKIQIQYTGQPDDLEDLIDENELENLKISYEIEYYGKTETKDELWEGLFDHSGRLLNKRIVKIKNTDNLDY